MASQRRDLCQRTFVFARDAVRLCVQLGRQAGAHRQVAGQLIRAATSVGANAEEAQAAFTRREFACKHSIVLREARESRFWLKLITATGLAGGQHAQAVDRLTAEADELVAIYTTIVRKLKLEKLT